MIREKDFMQRNINKNKTSSTLTINRVYEDCRIQMLAICEIIFLDVATRRT